jgi:two-component system phosphate regulon sensor histidine kinase PhoR
VRHIQRGSSQLRRLVDDLLDFARAEAGTLRIVKATTNLAETLSRTIESLAPAARDHQLRIESVLPVGPVWAVADAGRISQVLTNLLGNSIKFTPKGGAIRVVLTTSPSELRIEVQDSGIGIDPEHLPRLFQKFYQVDSSFSRRRGGVGLGLSIAQSIVEAHGGRIGVESLPGHGSTFWFTLPAASEDFVGEASPSDSAQRSR